MRYIHLNPLRAGMVENLENYRWSSHRQYRGQDDTGIAEPRHLLRLFSDVRKDAVMGYEKYMGEGGMKDKDGEIMYSFGKHAVGSEDFVRNIKLLFKGKTLSEEINNRMELKKVYGQDVILGAVCGYYGLTWEELKKKGGWNSRKPVAYYLLSMDGGLKNTQIAELFGKIHPSMVGRKIHEVSTRMTIKNGLRKEVEMISEKYQEKMKKSIYKV
jgi:hypothetical protein